ncbi:toxin [cyanobacterium TDX16]|nr:toxin [cyanobacterium TDX16]
MKAIRWNTAKNALLQAERGISFEVIEWAIAHGGLVARIPHPNQVKYQRQEVFVVLVESYVYLVPFIEEEDYIFLKTIIPSRKATKKYLTEKSDEKDEKV